MHQWLVNDLSSVNDLALYLFDRIIKPAVAVRNVNSFNLLAEFKRFVRRDIAARQLLSTSYPFFEITDAEYLRLLDCGKVLLIDTLSWSLDNAFIINKGQLNNNSHQYFYRQDEFILFLLLEFNAKARQKIPLFPVIYRLSTTRLLKTQFSDV